MNRFVTLPALLCGLLSSCAPRHLQSETLLPETPLPAVEQDLLQQYQNGRYGWLLYLRAFSALGTDLGTVYIYKNNLEVDSPATYSLAAESEVSPSRTLSFAEDYLDDLVEKYHVTAEEAEVVADYLENRTEAADPERLRIEVRYAAGKPKGVILLYARALSKPGPEGDVQNTLLARKLISPSLALSIMHFCSVELIGYDSYNTFLKSDYDIATVDGRIKFVDK